MRSITSVLVCLIMAMAAINVAAQDANSNTKIVAGHSIGPVKIGDPSKEVVKFYGQPTDIFNRSTGIKEYVWNFTKPEDYAVYDEIRIIFASDRTIQIKATSPRYSLPGGYSPGTTLAQVFQKYKNLKRNVYTVLNETGSGYQAHFYDDVKAGVAFMVGAQDSFDHRAPVSAIYVHRPNKPVMPDAE